MLASLFKPKWQNSNVRVRMRAIPDLKPDGAELIQLAQHDENTGVRLEAIAYLTDLPTLLKLGPRNDSIGERARQRLMTLAKDSHDYDEQLAEAFGWLQQEKSFIEEIAQDDKRHISLRKQAVQSLDTNNSELLFSIARQSHSLEIQYLAASRLQDTEQLKQLEKTQAKKNKRLRQLIRERLSQQQARAALHEQLKQLCTKMDALGQDEKHWAQDKTEYHILSQSWKTHQNQDDIPLELEQRFQTATRAFNERLQYHEAKQAQLKPLLEVYEACLDDAQKLQQQLNTAPEQLTLSALEHSLSDLTKRWEQAESLPEQHLQDDLEQRWSRQWQQLDELQEKHRDDLKNLDHFHVICRQAEKLLAGSQFLQRRFITDLQANWVKIKRPPHLNHTINELEQNFHHLIGQLSTRLKQEQEKHRQVLDDIKANFEQMEQDLNQEKYGEAVDLYQKISHQLKDHPELLPKEKNALKKRLQAVAPVIMEFKDWRRWGTDQVREQLIHSAEQLEQDASLDPQERAKKVRALREEWRQLAKMEPGKQHRQWKSFDSKATAAYESSKQYFAEQAVERQAHLEKRQQICEQLEELKTGTDWSQVDWKELYAHIRDIRKAWKKSGSVARKDWKAINERFNLAMDALEEHLSVEREQNFRQRQLLVEQAALLADIDDPQEAATKARHLQSQWQITIPSRSGEEQKLWKQFRKPIDAVFQGIRDERDAQRNEMQERITQKESLCECLETLAKADATELQGVDKTWEEIREQFTEIRDLPQNVHQKLESRFRQAENALQNRLHGEQRNQRLAELDNLAQQSDVLKTTLSDNEALQRDHQTQGEALCLQLEIFLELETPKAFQAERMQYQMSRMQEAMLSRQQSDDISAERFERSLSLLQEWYRLGEMPAEALLSQQARIAAIRQEILK